MIHATEQAKKRMSRDVFYSRERGGLFHANLSFHIIESLGVDDAQDLVKEIFCCLHGIVSSRRGITGGCQFYFGGFKSFRKCVFYNAFFIESLNMRALNIAIKYNASTRDVWRGIRHVRNVNSGGLL